MLNLINKLDLKSNIKKPHYSVKIWDIEVKKQCRKKEYK